MLFRSVAALLARLAPSVRHPAGTRFVVQEIKLPGIPVVHLFGSGRASDRVSALLAQIAPSVRHPAGTRFVVQEIKLPGIPVVHLLSGGRAWATLALWTLFFMSLLDLYLLSNWLPTVLNDLGASVSAAAIIGSMLQVGGVIGAFTLGQFIDRFSFRALALIYFVASIAVAAIGFSGHSIALSTVAIFCAGFCIVGGQGGSNALAATSYPTTIRSTGVGWALGIGRVGSIVGPLVGGIMLTRRMSNESVFAAAAVPALCACLASFALSRIAAASKPPERWIRPGRRRCRNPRRRSPRS